MLRHLLLSVALLAAFTGCSAVLAACVKNPTLTVVTPDSGYTVAVKECATIEVKKK